MTGELICSADDGSLGDTLVHDESALYLSGRETMTGDVDDIVDTTLDPYVPVLVTSSAITGEEIPRVGLHEANTA